MNSSTPLSPRVQPVLSPVDGSRVGEVTFADAAALNAAVVRARTAFESWGTTPVKERVQPLYRFKQIVERDVQTLGELVTAENGKTVGESIAGIKKGLEVVEYACSLPAIEQGGLLEVSRGVDCFTRRYPLGVAAGITPFNFPAMVPLWMVPLAIATGNTFLLKPSEQTPLTADKLGEYLAEAGLPEHVYQVVHGGREVVEGLLDHPGVDAAAFVGSTRVAKLVHARGAAHGKRTLALGGAKNHLVAVPDADPQITARNVVSSACGCAGQRCMAASVLILVGDADHLLDAVAAEMRKVVAGENMGAIISRTAKERIEGYITRAEASGARLLLDGRGVSVPGRPGGHYVGATLIDGVEPGHEAACDEIFGPVLTVLRVETLDDALAIENASPYGNAASIYTSSGATARYFEMRASAGMIGVNIGVPVPREPFAFGGWNDSKFGQGDVTGADGLRFWTKAKKVTQKWTASAASNWMS